MRAALRATYGLDLRDILETRSMPAGDLADLVRWLPPGSPFWMDYGGPASLTAEVRELRLIEFRLRELTWVEAGGTKAGKRPQPPVDPPLKHEKRAEESEMQRKAAAYARRHGPAR